MDCLDFLHFLHFQDLQLFLDFFHSLHFLDSFYYVFIAVENGQAKAFSQLEIASYRDSINHEAYINQ